MSPAAAPEPRNAGFTLIEVLVALSIVAVSLSSIGALMATNVRATKVVDARLFRLETTRSVLAALPEPEQLVPGVLAGDAGGHAWRIDVAPFDLKQIGAKPSLAWSAEVLSLTVQSPFAGPLQINTVRLRRREGG